MGAEAPHGSRLASKAPLTSLTGQMDNFISSHLIVVPTNSRVMWGIPPKPAPETLRCDGNVRNFETLESFETRPALACRYLAGSQVTMAHARTRTRTRTLLQLPVAAMVQPTAA